MSKYNIVVETISLEQSPFTATGTLDGVSFEARTIHYNGGLIWKLVENGLCPAPVDLSQFTRGQRSAAARWLKLVEGDQSLLNTGSQMSGAKPSPARQQANAEKEQMKKEIEDLRAMVQALLEQQNK